MVSFVCNQCQETIKKPKLDQHKGRCYGANFSCIDCYTDFKGTDYRGHTSCISEAEKHQKSLYKGPKKNQQNNNNNNNNNNRNNSNNKDNKVNFNNNTETAKPISIMEELKTKEDNKRKEIESSREEATSKKSKSETKEKELTKWDKKELPSDIKLTIQLGIKRLLEKNDNLSYKKLLKKLTKLVEEHPKKAQFKAKDIELNFNEMINFKFDNDKIQPYFN